MSTTRTSRRQSDLRTLALCDFAGPHQFYLAASQTYADSNDAGTDRQRYYAARDLAYRAADDTRANMILACFGLVPTDI